MEAFELCVEASGESLLLSACSDAPEQKFEIQDNGLIQGAATGRCFAVEAGEGEDASGPSHVRRDLLFSQCSELDSALSLWTLPGLGAESGEPEPAAVP